MRDVQVIVGGRSERTIEQCVRRGTLHAGCAGNPIDYDAPANAAESYEADHFHSVSTHPQLANDPENLRPSHSGCNRSRGNKAIDTDTWVQSETWD